MNELDLDLEKLIKKIPYWESLSCEDPDEGKRFRVSCIERITLLKRVYDRRKRRERIKKAEYYDSDSIPYYKLPDWYDK